MLLWNQEDARFRERSGSDAAVGKTSFGDVFGSTGDICFENFVTNIKCCRYCQEFADKHRIVAILPDEMGISHCERLSFLKSNYLQLRQLCGQVAASTNYLRPHRIGITSVSFPPPIGLPYADYPMNLNGNSQFSAAWVIIAQI